MTQKKNYISKEGFFFFVGFFFFLGIFLFSNQSLNSEVTIILVARSHFQVVHGLQIVFVVLCA